MLIETQSRQWFSEFPRVDFGAKVGEQFVRLIMQVGKHILAMIAAN